MSEKQGPEAGAKPQTGNGKKPRFEDTESECDYDDDGNPVCHNVTTVVRITTGKRGKTVTSKEECPDCRGGALDIELDELEDMNKIVSNQIEAQKHTIAMKLFQLEEMKKVEETYDLTLQLKNRKRKRNEDA